MKSTTTARMPETTLIRVTLSILHLNAVWHRWRSNSTTFVDWLLDSVWLSCCLQVVHLHIPPCYWHVPNSEQDVNRGSRTVTREILHRFALASYCAAEIFQVSCLGSSILEIALFGTGADNLWSLSKKPRYEFAG